MDFFSEYIELFIFIIILPIFFYVIFFEKLEKGKGKRQEYFVNSIICFLITIVLIAMSVPNQFGSGGRRQNPMILCRLNQLNINTAIEKYNMDSEIKIPNNSSEKELKKIIDDILVKNEYLNKAQISNLKECECVSEYELKNNEIYCKTHGSINEPIEQKRKNRLSFHRSPLLLVIALLAFIAMIKYFIFIPLAKNEID